MTVHRIYTIDGQEYHARNKFYDDDPRHYAIYQELPTRFERIGRARKTVRGSFWVLSMDGYLLTDDCPSLKDAVTVLLRELERRAARRKATKVNWGDVIVPRLSSRQAADGKTSHLVYDANRPGSDPVGIVSEIAPGQWQTTPKLGNPWADSPFSIRETVSAGVQDIVDVVAQGLRPPYQLGDEASEEGDDEEEDERPDDAVDCPQCDQYFADPACSLCGGRRWVSTEAIAAHLGSNRVPCLQCGGEGEATGPGPVSWSCLTCLGTGRMPVSELARFDLAEHYLYDQDWSGADLAGCSVRDARFSSCDFSQVNFDGADLSGTTFEDCQFTGANPERAASLEGTELLVTGLSAGRLARCIARGATVLEDEENEEDGDE
jgi:hypothetical protein